MVIGVGEVNGTMEQLNTEAESYDWILQVIKELRSRNITQVTLEHDLSLPPGWVKKVRDKKVKEISLNTFLKIWKYLGYEIKAINKFGKLVYPGSDLNTKTIVDLSKIKKAGRLLDMSSLYASRDRAISELEGLGNDYNLWGRGSHLKLQLAADNIMLVNIMEELFHYAGRKGGYQNGRRD